jgi:hypothetical protein
MFLRPTRAARPFGATLSAALFLSVSTSVSAAPKAANKNAKATVDVRTPIAIQNPADLDFATLSVTGAGTARINPTTGQMTTTGGVTYLSGTPNPARYRLTTNRIAIVFIDIPSAPITLRRQGGTETMTVSSWTLDGSGIRITGGVLDFNVGGTLNVSANQKEGVYTGTFMVSADYL